MDAQQTTPDGLDDLVLSADPPVTRVEGVLDPRVEWFRAGDEVDSFLVRAARFDLVVDTMSTPEMFADVLAASPLRRGLPTLVVITHADYDHHWGTSCLTGRDHVLIAAGSGRERVLAQQAELDRMNTATRGRFGSVVLRTAHLGVSGPTLLDGGDLSVRLLPTPGHTPDHLAVHVPELGLVLAGDAAERPLPELWDEHSLPALRASLESLVALDPAVVVPSHGGTTDPAILTDGLAVFEQIERRVARGEPVDDLVSAVPPGKQAFYRHCLRRAESAVSAPRKDHS